MTTMTSWTSPTTVSRTSPTSPTGRTTVRPPVANTALDLLDRARESLLEAICSQTAAERYVAAHLGALRASAAVLATRGRPGRRGGPRSVWEVLPAVAPELAEWAAFFAAGAARRAAAESGRREVGAREADDLLRDAETYLSLVETTLGVPPRTPLPDVTLPVAR